MGSELLVNRTEHILIQRLIFRLCQLFVVLFILPISFTCRLLTSLRNSFFLSIQSASKAHPRKVAVLQKEICEWNKSGRKNKLCNARPPWQMMGYRMANYKRNMKLIHTDWLGDILDVNTEERIVQVEPMVTIGQLLDCLIPLGFTLPLVPPFEDLTVGGLLNGSGVASSGRKYGMFQHICISYELLMPDGSLIIASKKANQSDNHALFYGVPWSHGTLGFVVSATLRITPCKPFVKLTYIPCHSFESTGDSLREEASSKSNEFVDAIVYSDELGVVMKGSFDDGPAKNQSSNPICDWYKPWFYKYVEGIGEKGDMLTEYIPIRQYYRRHSRSLFWGIQKVVPWSGSVLIRCLVGWLVPPKVALLKAVASICHIRDLIDSTSLFQDLLVPIVNLDETLHIVHDEFQVYPLWLCPFNIPSAPGIVRQRSGRNVMYVDVGVYGDSQKVVFDRKDSMKSIEEFLLTVSGLEMPCGDTYLDRSQFWDMFDSSLYEWLRVKYGCRGALPDAYDKVNHQARY